MSYGIEVIDASSTVQLASYNTYAGTVVDVRNIPASSGDLTFTYSAFTGATLTAVFTTTALSANVQGVTFSGSPPSITVPNAAFSQMMVVFVSSSAPASAGSGYSIECLTDDGNMLPLHGLGAAATLIAKTSSASATAISFSTPYNGTWAFGWRFTVTTHTYEPLVFVVPPAMSSASAALWVERVAQVSGTTGAKVWEVDIGCVDYSARVALPTVLFFDRRLIITSGSPYGVQVFDSSGNKTYDTNDGRPLRITNLMSYGSYFGSSPYNGAKYAARPAGLTYPAVMLSRNAGQLSKTIAMGAGGTDYYKYSLQYFRDTSGNLWRTGLGYAWSFSHTSENTGSGTSDVYTFQSSSLLVTDASLY